MLSDYISDLKLNIASVDEDTWYILWRFDQDFRKYASSRAGIAKFIELFKKVEFRNGVKLTSIFGSYHSFDDEPAIEAETLKIWKYRGIVHRDNDLPAMESKTLGKKFWYIYGDVGRIEGRPVIEDSVVGLSIYSFRGTYYTTQDGLDHLLRDYIGNRHKQYKIVKKYRKGIRKSLINNRRD